MREMQQSATADQFISGLEYPTTREGILAAAREAKLADDIVAELSDIPDREYKDAEDLTAALNAA